MAGLKSLNATHYLFTDEKDFSVAVKHLQNIGKTFCHFIVLN